jgi:CBS domain-containing protein
VVLNDSVTPVAVTQAGDAPAPSMPIKVRAASLSVSTGAPAPGQQSQTTPPHKTVRQLRPKEPLVVDAGNSVAAVAMAMTQKRSASALVVKDGALQGIVSDSHTRVM